MPVAATHHRPILLISASTNSEAALLRGRSRSGRGGAPSRACGQVILKNLLKPVPAAHPNPLDVPTDLRGVPVLIHNRLSSAANNLECAERSCRDINSLNPCDPKAFPHGLYLAILLEHPMVRPALPDLEGPEEERVWWDGARHDPGPLHLHGPVEIHCIVRIRLLNSKDVIPDAPHLTDPERFRHLDPFLDAGRPRVEPPVADPPLGTVGRVPRGDIAAGRRRGAGGHRKGDPRDHQDQAQDHVTCRSVFLFSHDTRLSGNLAATEQALGWLGRSDGISDDACRLLPIYAPGQRRVDANPPRPHFPAPESRLWHAGSAPGMAASCMATLGATPKGVGETAICCPRPTANRRDGPAGTLTAPAR